jgi:D-alanyl-lipoteichoic acid acyltransferase DltB (MBOAT superfamily)
MAVLEQIGNLLRYDPRAPLIFSSGLFLFLLLGFTFFYRFMRNRVELRIVYVLLFSLYFYYKSSGVYFLLLLFVAASDYFIGLWLARARSRRGWLVALSATVNLGLLGYFKYTNFFIGIANSLSGADILDFRNIFLPVGISFFVFQSMSYTIDIYRRRIEPLHNWLDYAFYLSFFPQLVAGPIVRARDFIPQIRQRPLRVTRGMFGSGVFLIAVGLFKKAVISDYISLNFVDRIFDNPLLYSGFENLMGVLGYAMQIYCDFSGYSDMAIGLALLLGFRFPRNFDSPYKSASITEFWRRWHISLSSWLKDYLYISLGGNRKGKLRTYLNLLVTMLLGGLWHGAAMRFVLWGGMHGVALAVDKALRPRYKAGIEMGRGRRIVGIIVTFTIVCASWILFRAPNMEAAVQMFTQIFTRFDARLIPQVAAGYGAVFGLIVLGYVTHFLPRRWEDAARRRMVRLPLWGMALVVVAVIWLVMQIKSADIQPFIYFQF